MTLRSCDQVEESLWRYVDRELPAREMAAISEHLRGCPSCRAVFERHSRESNMWRWALDGTPFGEEFVERFHRRIADELDSATVSSLPESGRSHRGGLLTEDRPAARWAFLAAAAVFAFAAVAGLLWQLRETGTARLGEFVVHRGEVGWSVEGRSRKLRGSEHGELVPGMRLDVSEDGALILFLKDDESPPRARLEIENLAIFRVSADSTLQSFEAELRRGRLHADVEPLKASESFLIRTPSAKVRVVGTEFVVEVTDSGTQVDVVEGTVELIASPPGGDGTGGQRVSVSAPSGAFRVAAGGGLPEPVREGVEGPASPSVSEGATSLPTGPPVEPAPGADVDEVDDNDRPAPAVDVPAASPEEEALDTPSGAATEGPPLDNAVDAVPSHAEPADSGRPGG